MKKGKCILALLSALVLAAIVLLSLGTLPRENDSSAPAVLQAGAEEITLWTGDGGTFYAFLPSHADPAQCRLLPREGTAVTLEGAALPLSCAALESGRDYTLRWEEKGEARQATLSVMSSGSLPTLYLTTRSGSMDHIHAEKGNAERGTARLYDENGTLVFSDSFASLRGRGNSTWDVPEKKPYSLDLTEAADLLGMGAAKSWILLADAMDASGLRNRIAYGFAETLGRNWVPEQRWTEVYLNGEYAGLYLLTERIENEAGRLDLGRDGVVLRMDRDTRIREETDPYFFTGAGQCLQILDGRDSIALRENVQAVEDALLTDDSSWQDRIDLDSWVDQYLMEEVFASYDAGFQSQYFYCYEPDGKLYAGPVWDYDASMGNPTLWAQRSARGLYAGRPEAIPGYETPWYHKLYEKTEFRQALAGRYRETFLPRLQALLDGQLDDYVARIGSAWERNRVRWQMETAGLEAEAEHIAQYLEQRMEFLSELWLEEKTFCIVRVRDEGSFYIHYALEPGSTLEELPHLAEYQWYREDTGEAYDLSTPIREDVYLDTVPGGVPEEEPDAPGLMDILLEVYHYVPAAVLVLMGLVCVPAALWKSRGAAKPRSKV